MKVARLLIMGTLLVLSASAGIITGGGYQADDAIPFVFQFIATGGNPVGTRALNGTDDGTISVPIGFNFQFFGQTYSSICLSTNGLATFGGCDNSADSVDFATSGPPNNLPSIAPQWDDWQFLNPTTDAAYYLTQGAPGSRQFLVQWNLAQHLSAPDNADETTFQLALFEGSNGILFSYLDVVSVGIGSFGGLSQVGIRDTDGDLNGRFLSYSFQQPSLNSELSILFTPTAGTPEASTLWLTAVGLGLVSCSRRFYMKRVR